MFVTLVLDVQKRPSAEGTDWTPEATEIAEEIAERVVGIDLDTGWDVLSVVPMGRTNWQKFAQDFLDGNLTLPPL